MCDPGDMLLGSWLQRESDAQLDYERELEARASDPDFVLKPGRTGDGVDDWISVESIPLGDYESYGLEP